MTKGPFRELSAAEVAAISQRNRASRTHILLGDSKPGPRQGEPEIAPKAHYQRSATLPATDPLPSDSSPLLASPSPIRKPKKLRPPCPSEHQEQVALIKWWDIIAPQHKLPACTLFAIPNAGAGAQRGQAGKMRGEGVRAGVPDLFLAFPTAAYAGLFIEMKRRYGHAERNQLIVHAHLRVRGYRVEVCNGFEPAKALIEAYLAGK